MCIIAIKPAGSPMQSKDTLKHCFTSNSDGAGYMFVNNGKVHIKKGFMTFPEFYASVRNDYFTYDLVNNNLVMHFRIGTSGESEKGCTHPFPISNNYDDLELLNCRTNIGICHNGIITEFNSIHAKYSDTEKYIAKVITPIIKLNLQAYKFPDIQNLILETTTSKWAILDKNDELYTIGNFVKDGVYSYSNGTYKAYTYTPSTTAYDWYKDEEGNEWYKKAITTQKSLLDTDLTYNVLKTGNVFCSKEIEYEEVEFPSTYYFDKEFNIYEKIDGELVLIATKALIYDDETFQKRLDFMGKLANVYD